MQIHRAFIAFTVAAVLLGSAAAAAQPRLAGSEPAPDSEAAAPARVTLRFDAPLVVRSSAARLVMTGMPGMADHPPMPVAVTVSAGEEPGTMWLTPRQPLVAGSYRVDWRAVSPDSQPVTGSVGFRVR